MESTTTLDGSPTISSVGTSTNFYVNDGTSYTMAYRLTRHFSISCFAERFSGRYPSTNDAYTNPTVLSRSGHLSGASAVYHLGFTQRLSINIKVGAARRRGHEYYGFYLHTRGATKHVWLADMGISSGLNITYALGKGGVVFGLIDYTRFMSKNDVADYPDGPTRNYVRTRIGIQYSLSHLLREKE